MARRAHPRLLLLTPPLVQTNTPYPATMHLVGYLRSQGYDAVQRDLSVRVVREVLITYGGDEAEEILELLSGPAPDEAKRAASEWIDELALSIRREVDSSFGFSRYAAQLGAWARDFSEVEALVRARGVLDGPLEHHLKQALDETKPDVVGVTCPFPGTLVAAFKIARYLKRHYPKMKCVLGGGFVSTELREMTDPRPRRYFDHFFFDEGYEALADYLDALSPRPRKRRRGAIPAFVCPSYEGISWDDYFDVVETENPMHRLWSTGRWVKLQMARGCYWHRCAFCDVRLPYIGCYEAPTATEIVDAMARFATAARPLVDFHFVDEAMPPALVRGVCEELLRRRLRCRWWGNVRFDLAYTPELAALMARAGCIAVTGGLECANDRLLSRMSKGITLASARRVLKAFHEAGILVHTYLMYAFPTETEEEAMGALDYVRRLFAADLVQSAFWHRFALTVHSPVASEAAAFGIRLRRPKPSPKGVFALNEIAYTEKDAPDWTQIGRVLELALYNYMQGRGLKKMVYYWKNLLEKKKED